MIGNPIYKRMELMSSKSNSNSFRKHTSESVEPSNTSSKMSPEELKSRLEEGQHLMVFDIGEKYRFERRHIPGSAYAVCDAAAKKNIMPKLPKNIEIVLVSDDDEYSRQMAQMMAQIGLNTRYLQGGINAWKWDMTESSSERNISSIDLKKWLDQGNNGDSLYLLDVREPDEFKEWNIEGSVNIPLSKLASSKESITDIPKDKRIVTICPHGNRSMVAKYLLERYGFNVGNMEGGLKSWSTSLEDAYREFGINKGKVRLYQIRRIGKGCMSYIVESDGDAAIIDPVYPIEYYLSKVSEIGAKVTKVFDTHQHADHVSAAVELSEKTGSKLCLSGYEQYDQMSNPLHHGSLEKIGSVEMNVIHTPGHTDGSLALLLQENDVSLLFTGDTLFVEGVGRPDLRDKSREFSEKLYDTLHHKILSLPDNILVFPSHTDKYTKAGEMISADLGWLKKNAKLLRLQKDKFVERIVSQTMATPPNYRQIISINGGKVPVPETSSDIFELEFGPNRCNVS
jgi:glyoxylase-like metal-dependent hydrolase (beta-lactamase superfamily II)/rhodanese-related sulfurtransferase